MSYFVCTAFDTFDLTTGFFVMKMDCIEWNENDLGPWEGPKYSTRAECLARSACTKVFNSSPTDVDIPSNNYCNIYISDIKLINKTSNTLTFNITVPENYEHVLIQYAFYDIENNILGDFKFVCNTPNPLPLDGTFTIQDDFREVCSIAFRLYEKCIQTCPPRTLIPVEDSGGAGSAGGHWENANRDVDYPTPDKAYYPGITYDIMDSFGSDAGLELSVQCLQDMGYVGSPDRIFDRCSWSGVSEYAREHIPNIQDIFEAAASEWEKYLSYDPGVYALIKATFDPTPLTPIGPDSGSGSESGSGCGDGTWNGLRMDGYFEADYGPGFLAACGVYDYVILDDGFVKKNSISFFILVNTYYGDFSDNFWTRVMIHEFGHALGIGTLWSGSDDFWLTKEDYPLAFEYYNSVSGSSCSPGNDCTENNTNEDNENDNNNQEMSSMLEHTHDENCKCGNTSVLLGWKPEVRGIFNKDKHGKYSIS